MRNLSRQHLYQLEAFTYTKSQETINGTIWAVSYNFDLHWFCNRLKKTTKPSDIKETCHSRVRLMPFKGSTSIMWKWFRLAKYVEHSKHKTSYAMYQHAYCCSGGSAGPTYAAGQPQWRHRHPRALRVCSCIRSARAFCLHCSLRACNVLLHFTSSSLFWTSLEWSSAVAWFSLAWISASPPRLLAGPARGARW